MSVSTTVMPSSSTIAPALLTPDSPPGWSHTNTPSASSCSVSVGTRAATVATRYAFRMSERSRHLPRRSCLSVPGSSEKMLGKAPGLGADMVFLDLEDAVAPLEKPAARGQGRERDQHARLRRERPVRARQRVGHRVDVPRRDRGRRGRVGAARRADAAEGGDRRRRDRARPPAHPDREGHRPPVARRHRGADRDRARAHQRRGDLRRERPARDDHPRSGRHVGVDGDAVARRRARTSPSTRATTSTTCS